MNTEEKENTLNNIETTYLYVSKKKFLEDSKDELNRVNNGLSNINQKINNVLNVQKDLRNYTYQPILKNPPEDSLLKNFSIAFIIFILIGILFGLIMSPIHSVKMMWLWNFFNIISFPVSSIGAIWITYKLYKKRKEKKFREYNYPIINHANATTTKVRNEANRLNSSLSDLKNNKDQLTICKNSLINETIPHALQDFKNVNTEGNHYLVPVTAEHKDDPEYYFKLYEVIKTGQDKELGAAIKTVESRLHDEQQTKQIINSQEKTRQLIIEGVKYMGNLINTGFDKIDNQLTQVNSTLNKIDNNLQNLQQQIAAQAAAIAANTAAMNAQTDTIRNQLNNLSVSVVRR